MLAHWEYDLGMGRRGVARLNAALLAVFAVMAIVICAVLPASAQMIGVPTGVPTSVTSIGFGGHFDRFGGVPPTPTSPGPRGYSAPTHLFVGSGFPPANPGQFHHH